MVPLPRSLLICCVCLTCAPAARADLVRLKSGGEIRGTIQTRPADESGQRGSHAAAKAVSKKAVADMESPTIESPAVGAPRVATPTVVQTLNGTLISISPDEIDFVERRSPLIEEYVTRTRQAPDTVEGKWELAEWCRSQSLLEERKEQLELLLDIDPDHPEARKILGYVKHLGRWMTREDEMAERGYFRYNGRWVTQQELELKEANASQRQAELEWMPKIRLSLIWLTGSDPQRASAGLNDLRAIQDPNAIAALNKLLGQHQQEEIRLLFVSILAKIDGPRAIPSLVERMLTDISETVRKAALTALTPARYSIAVPTLIAGLKHKSNAVVNRAAEALAEIGDERAIPPLIDALVTRNPVQIQVPASQGISFNTGGNNIGPFSGSLPPDVEIAARTGQLPYGVQVLPDNIPRQMKTVIVTREFKNIEVLNALEKMTGNNLGFNERDWHYWWAIQKS